MLLDMRRRWRGVRGGCMVTGSVIWEAGVSGRQEECQMLTGGECYHLSDQILCLYGRLRALQIPNHAIERYTFVVRIYMDYSTVDYSESVVETGNYEIVASLKTIL
uniref:Uncharacterized protein n=1 Tax=Leersia perrieri TaxID=77586 RepID=A0A0D9WTE7_9ORYZ